MRVFWLPYLSLAFLAGSLSTQKNDVAFSKCWKQRTRPLQDADFVWYKSSVLSNIVDCIEMSIFDSENLCDQMNINIKKLSKALRLFCSKFDVQSCRMDLFKQDEPHKKPAEDKLRSYADCIYDKYERCNRTVAQVIKHSNDIKSNTTHVFLAGSLCDKEIAAILSKCWKKIPNPYERIKKYGKVFYDNVTNCIEKSIYDTEHLYEQLNFEVCSKFDVVSCQEDYYTRDYGTPKSVDELLKIYSECIYDKYTTCDTTLDKIIKYNLVGIKTDTARSLTKVAYLSSNTTHLSTSFVFIASHVLIILLFFF